MIRSNGSQTEQRTSYPGVAHRANFGRGRLRLVAELPPLRPTAGALEAGLLRPRDHLPPILLHNLAAETKLVPKQQFFDL